jgi:anti-sigma B factor antagonist
MSEASLHGDGLFELAVLQRGRQGASVMLSGEIDLASAPELQHCLAWLVSFGVVQIVLDLTNVTFLGSTGISVFVMALKRTEQAGGSLIVSNASPAAFRIFEITGLVDLLSVSGVEHELEVAPVTSVRRLLVPRFDP